ncbi:alpha/beta fold hydrolase [Pseudolysinimonas sp.]|jgi:pimeloyl-ACP methyl ester carboxylesterase|uniref:alpha/beta fold hydrolase n=1 Tax=Pseudolysinimonas sp. TaxID=2680009 RepID=UPI003783ED40
MAFAELNGVSAYYDVTGSGEPVIFLHGGFCSAEVMRELSEQLSGYAVHAPERPGHGRTPDRPGPFHYDDGVADTIALMDVLGLTSAHVLGFSDGADIGMLLALAHPDRVRSLVHISGNLRPGDDVYRPEEDHAAAMPAAESERVSLEYAELSPDGPEHADVVGARILHMWETEPAIDPASLATVDLPVLVMAGDRDIIAPEHTALIHRSIPGAQLAIVPATSHMLVRERPGLVGRIVQEFLDAVPR